MAEVDPSAAGLADAMLAFHRALGSRSHQRDVERRLVGGLSEAATLHRGPATVIAAEVRDAVRQVGGAGVIVSPGCVLPLDVADAHLAAVVDATRAARP